MNKKLKKVIKLSDEIFNLSTILKGYCEAYHQELEEMLYIASFSEYIYKKIDLLNSTLIKYKAEKNRQ